MFLDCRSTKLLWLFSGNLPAMLFNPFCTNVPLSLLGCVEDAHQKISLTYILSSIATAGKVPPTLPLTPYTALVIISL